MMALGSVQNQYLDGTYSMSCAQETYAAADRAVIAIIRQCHEDARRMLEENRELLDSFNQRQCKAWLFATARNLYCDQLRRKMKEESLMREMLPEGDEEPPDQTAEAALGTVDLETLLELLDPLDRAMFTLRYEEGYNASELGKIFHLPPGTVRTRLRKARTLLKHELLEE